MKRASAAETVRVRMILRRLAKAYPDARCALDFRTPLELLIATILSAQCTDVRVNMVTPALFAKYRSAEAYAAADPRDLETLIQSTGFFRAKAKSIQAACRIIIEDHGGDVPRDLESLVKLPGVGRKTANVVLGNCFDVPGITVDTHVGRLSRRLGLTKLTDPVKVEHDLMAVIPEKDWVMFSHRMIFHGRQICHARKPDCSHCVLEDICPKIGV
jgi:endonuclease-3